MTRDQFSNRKETASVKEKNFVLLCCIDEASSVFFIGGWDGSSPLSIIAKYENDNWSHHGNLKRRREGHGSITYGTTTFVIGGGTDDGS